MPFTYILFTDRFGRFYTGSCDHLDKRIKRHNQGRNPSTKYGVPWKLVWHRELPTLGEARKLEIKIKKRGASRFLEDLKSKN